MLGSDSNLYTNRADHGDANHASGKRFLGRSRTFWAVIGSMTFVIGITCLFGLQMMSYWQMHKYAKKFAILDRTPRPLPTVAISSSPTTKLAGRGYSFQSPWTDFDVEKSKFPGSCGVFAFRSHSAILFCAPEAGSEDLRATVKNLVGNSLEKLVGSEAMKSDYAFRAALLATTTRNLTPWMSQRESIRTDTLLMFKATSSIGGNTGLFQVESNGWRGFQFDDPTKGPKNVTLELYDSQDRHVEIVFIPNRSTGIGLTQQEINRVVQSLSLSNSNAIASTTKPQARVEP